MNVRVRFAPSPTGFLHVGGARTALFNYLDARARGGRFVLRIEDTDAARSTDEATRAILGALRWLGLAWDEGPEAGGAHGPYTQAGRRDRYAAHAAALVAAGRAYPCFCAPEDLDARRARQLERGEPLRYDGRCRGLDATGRAARAAAGAPAAIRYALTPGGEVAWDDVVRGRIAFQREVLDDFVILRADGLPTYNFACVADDHDMEISDVIRGDDHISNTPRQLLLYEALEWVPPRFAHVPMILGADGTRLSKRHGATSVEAFRDLGILPEAMVNFLALLGWAEEGGERELYSLAELERAFRLERVGRNPAVFNLEKLLWLNGQHLKRLPEEERVRRVCGFLAARGRDLSRHDPAWWALLVRAVGDRLRTLADAERYGGFALDDALDMEEDAWQEASRVPGAAARWTALAGMLERTTPYDLPTLERETRALAASLGVKAGELIGLARVALTGRKVSPGIFEVMALLGREKAVERLRAAAGRAAAVAAPGS